jgi:DNA-binding Xre family transcriptional regulator
MGRMTIINRLPELIAKKFGGEENINMVEIQLDTRLTYSTVFRWVKGERIDRIDIPVLETWCEYLNCEPGDILQRKAD